MASNFLNEQTLKDILTTAVEGGINYWCHPHDGDVQNIQIHRDDNLSVVEIQCETNVDGEGWICQEITTKVLRKAINAMKDDEKAPAHWRKFCSKLLFNTDEDYDAEGADVLVQYAMFKDIVFG